MAKRKNRRRRGFGNIIEVRRGMNGLFDSNTVVGDALPVVLGGLSAAGAIAVIRRFIVPRMSAGSSAGTMLNRHAPLLGIGAGVLMGLGLHVGLKRKSPAVVAATAAAFVGLGSYLREGTLLPASAGAAGFGAIVPEYGMSAVMPQMNGLGATVLEPWPNGRRPDSIGALSAPDSQYGTSMQLSGMGNVNPNAFGSPGFAIH